MWSPELQYNVFSRWSINRFRNVIQALAEGTKRHIPYRNSTLTRLLQDGLDGNSKTSLIVSTSFPGSPDWFAQFLTSYSRHKSIYRRVCYTFHHKLTTKFCFSDWMSQVRALLMFPFFVFLLKMTALYQKPQSVPFLLHRCVFHLPFVMSTRHCVV